jgi:putative Mn2+ efflux pump MntP
MILLVKSEESKVGIVLLLTFALFLITGVLPQYVLETTAIMVALGVIVGVYMWRAGMKTGERKDERTERCSLLASRNAFLAGILLTTFLAVLVQLGTQLDPLESLRTIWSLGMATYLLSYLVYKRAV